MKNTTTSETIGCDLGDKFSHLCILRANGTVKVRKRIPTTLESMAKAFTRRPAHVVIEVGAHSRWVSGLLTQLGHRVTVANARRVKLISQSNNKMDPHDAELLARLGRSDVTLLAPIKHRSVPAQADLALAKARDELVAARTKLINHVRGTCKSFGVRLPKVSSSCFVRKSVELIPPELKPSLEALLNCIDKLTEQIRAQDKLITQMVGRYPEAKLLMQVDGIGALIALVFVLTIDDGDRFSKSRMVGAFLGLRPRKSASGDSDPQLRITKTGDSFVRRLLVNSANYILGPLAKDSDLRRWGLSLAQRGGKNAKKRAKVAVARKLAVLLHRLWVTGEIYEPIGYRHPRIAQNAAA